MLTSVVLLAIVASCVQSQTELVLPPLPYAYTALEPVLSEHLMRLHHDKHYQSYMNKTNMAIKAMLADTQHGDRLKEIAKLPVELLLTRLQDLPEQYHISLRHQAGGYLNHKLFFAMLQKPTGTAEENKPTGALLAAIEKNFGSFDKFKGLFTGAAMNLFGSGWVWLYIDARTNQLVLNFTANQDNPIMFDKNHIVVLGIDLWEHGYYPVYENRRNEYIDNFWRIINWSYVSQLFVEGQAKRIDL